MKTTFDFKSTTSRKLDNGPKSGPGHHKAEEDPGDYDSAANGLRPEEFMACYAAFHPSVLEFLPYIRWGEALTSMQNRHASWAAADPDTLAVASGLLYIEKSDGAPDIGEST